MKSIFTPILEYFTGKINEVKSAFDKGIIQGIQAILVKFSPVTWIGDTPHTLSLTAMEFLGLATYASKDHQEGCLGAGWLRTERIRNATTLAALEEIANELQG